MKLKFLLLPALVFGLVFVPAASVQARKPVEKAVVADTPEKFEQLVQKIQGEMTAGARYEFLDTKDRAGVNGIFERMLDLLRKAGSVDAMSPEDRTALMSYQEKVNGILARNADDRLVCTHVAPVGSHLPITTCRSVRELARQRESYRHQTYDLEDQKRALNAASNNSN
jgi:hypothetical protein